MKPLHQKTYNAELSFLETLLKLEKRLQLAASKLDNMSHYFTFIHISEKEDSALGTHYLFNVFYVFKI